MSENKWKEENRDNGWTDPKPSETTDGKTPTTPGIVLSDFCDYTSTHGPAHVKRVQNNIGKAFWVLVMLGCVSVLTWQVVVLLTAYLRYDYNVLLEVELNRTLRFPAVTVCNLNPYRLSQLNESVSSDDELNNFVNRLNEDDVATNDSFSDEYDYWNNYEVDYYTYDSDYYYESSVREIINTYPKANKTVVGHQIENMLLDCKYAGKPCTIKNFTASWNVVYGNCYTFSDATARELHVDTAGPNKGLTLELYTELNEYVQSLSPQAGFKVLVHDNYRVPFPDKDGITVSSGFSTNIGVRKLQIERLHEPYVKCAPVSTDDSRNIYSNHYPNSYSLDVCGISCYQHQVLSVCQCVDSTFPIDHPSLAGNTSFCSKVSENASSCQEDTWDQFVNGLLCTECVQACSESKFYTTVSSSVWPTPNAATMVKFRTTLEAKRQPSIIRWMDSLQLLTSNEVTNDIRNNVAKIVVFYEDLNYEKIVQKPAYTFISLVSNFGGLFGLWIGMSVLSICELFEFCGRLVLSAFQKRAAVGSINQ